MLFVTMNVALAELLARNRLRSMKASASPPKSRISSTVEYDPCLPNQFRPSHCIFQTLFAVLTTLVSDIGSPFVDNRRTHRDHIPRIFHASNGDFPASFRHRGPRAPHVLMVPLPICRIQSPSDLPGRSAARELHARCASEYLKAEAARAALQRILSAGGVTVSQVGPDKYRGRIDAAVATRDTPDVAAALLKGGFARSYDGGRREPWC
jgi:hypothetical protein